MPDKISEKDKSPKRKKTRSDRPRCGLCGATKNLMKTECCGQWICDDEHKYVLFSYSRNSCSRNHRRLTLCGIHYGWRHSGHWKDCEKCRREFDTEDYVYFGTNEYNFEVLENPPSYEPTKCSGCGAVIIRAEGGYSSGRDGHKCRACSAAERSGLLGE